MPDNLSCEQAYWLKLDYLKTAEAALQCGACFTALLAVEQWWKQVGYGPLTLEEAASAAAAPEVPSSVATCTDLPVPLHVLLYVAPPDETDACLRCKVHAEDGKVQQLLLDIYGQIDEPDSIYAVARSHELPSQLRLMQHEGEAHFYWSNAHGAIHFGGIFHMKIICR